MESRDEFLDHQFMGKLDRSRDLVPSYAFLLHSYSLHESQDFLCSEMKRV